jgi:hypothetical protein
MATRMTTLLYGDKPEADVEPGNRVDTTDSEPPASPPPMRPMRVSPAQPHPFAMRGLFLGLAAAASVLVGLTVALIAVVWSRSITPAAQVTLVVLGLALVAGGTAYVAGSTTYKAR